MNPLLDQLLVALIVLGAIAYFCRLLMRRRTGGKGCGGGCGCNEGKAGKTLP